jgi:hypothetical protein
VHLGKALVNAALIGLVVACGASPAHASNIVLNGGFETGDFTDWTTDQTSSFPWGIDSGSGAFAGMFFASTGCVGAQCITGSASQAASLSQVLTTTPGTVYNLTFEFDTQNAPAPNELEVLWDGQDVLDLGPGGTLGRIPSYSLYTVSRLVGTGSDTLTFLARQDTGFDSLDNISVAAAGSITATPEPSTLLLIGAITPLIAAKRRFRAATFGSGQPRRST